ncbi:unnamed protein product [Cunninghamella blakesleeana]
MSFPYFKIGKSSAKQSSSTSSKNGSTSSEHSQDKIQPENPPLEAKFPDLNYEYIEGRNFKQGKEGKTELLPCDDEECERLEINHIALKCLFGTTHISPVEEALKKGVWVLELNCGPGCWIKELAKLYPNSHFVGVDDIIYPISNPPINSHFRTVDFSKALEFEDNYFDLVIQRTGVFKFTKEVWENVISESIRVTKPGGYIEIVEPSHSYNDVGPNFSLWMMRLTVSMQTRGLNSKIGTELEQILGDNNQLEIYQSTHRSAPVGWLGRTGDLMLDALLRFCDSVKPRLCEDWSMPIPKYEATVSGLANECQEFKTWTNVYCVSAKKIDPTDATNTTTTTATSEQQSIDQSINDDE